MENIENKIKQLADNQSIAPPSFVWDNIENSLRPKHNKKGIFWLFFGLLFLAGSLIWMVSENTTPTLEDQNATITEAEKPDEGTDFSTIVIEKEDNKETSMLQSELSTSLEIQDKKDLPGKINNSLFPIKKSNDFVPTNVQTAVSNHSESQIANEFNHLEGRQNSEEGSENRPIASLQELESVLEIESVSIHLEYERALVKLNKIVECPSFSNRKKISTFLEVGGLLGKHSKTINDGSNRTLATLRRGSESSWYAYGIYGVAGINITPGFYFGVGLDWTQSKDKFYSAQDAITKMIITFDPNTGIPIDTSFVTGNLINQGEIRYTTIDLPVLVGLTRNYQTWDFGVEIGGVMNLSFASYGKIFSEASNISHLNKETDVYKSRLGFGLKTSLLIRKNLKDGLSIQLKPTFRTYLNEINADGYALPTNYSVFGINLGLRKDF